MSLADNIDDFATDTSAVVTRTTAETYDTQGRKVAGSTSTLLVTIVETPLNGRDLQVKIDCQITTEARALLTKAPLKDREPGFQPDVVTLDGEPWVVFNRQDWPDLEGGKFYKVLVARRSLT